MAFTPVSTFQRRLGPMRPVTFPCSTAKLTSSTAVRPAKDLTARSIVRASDDAGTACREVATAPPKRSD